MSFVAIQPNNFAVAVSPDPATFELYNQADGENQKSTFQALVGASNLPWARVTGAPTEFQSAPSKLSNEGATDGQAIVWNAANNRYEPGDVLAAVSWNDIPDKPTAFAPAAHTHELEELGAGTAIAGQFISYNGTFWTPTTLSVSWNDIPDKPTAFVPTTHTHLLSEIDRGGATESQVLAWNNTANSWVPFTLPGGGNSVSITDLEDATGDAAIALNTYGLSMSNGGLIQFQGTTIRLDSPLVRIGSAGSDLILPAARGAQGQVVTQGVDGQLIFSNPAGGSGESVIYQIFASGAHSGTFTITANAGDLPADNNKVFLVVEGNVFFHFVGFFSITRNVGASDVITWSGSINIDDKDVAVYFYV